MEEIKSKSKRGDHDISSDTRRLLCVEKPSYLLGLGPKASRNEYLKVLPKILSELLRQRNWKDASGTLSVLMQGTVNDYSPKMNRLKYEAQIQILCHLHPNKNKAQEITDIYDTWIGKIGKQYKEERLLVCFQQICHFLEHGMAEDAHNAVISMQKNRDFGTLPRSNLYIGITYYKMWCRKFFKQFQSDDAECTESRSNMSMDESGSSVESEGSTINKSEASVMNYKDSHMSVSDSGTKPDSKDQAESPQHFTNPPQLYTATSEENEVPSQDGLDHTFDPDLIKILGDMDPWLLPLKPPGDTDCYMRMVSDSYYKDALKHLRLTVQAPPHVTLVALHQLVQLLLIGGHVDEAMKVVEEICNKVYDIKPLRIKAAMMEKFHHNSYMLSESYEDIMKVDPTCVTTLKKLIGMCRQDKYSKESLIKMIAVHVEASYPEPGIWEEFASCLRHFFKNVDEDRMSACFNIGSGQVQTYSVRYNPSPKIFADQSWKLRAKWWLHRHFSTEMLETEIKNCKARLDDPDWKLVTYKAACASHIYGREFGYVAKVHGLLEKTSKYRYLFKSLQEHRENGNMIYNPSN